MLSGRISAFPCRHAANNRCGTLPGIPTKTVRKAYAARYPVPKPSADRTHRSEIPRRSTAPPAIPEKLLRTSTRTHFPASGFCFSARRFFSAFAAARDFCVNPTRRCGRHMRSVRNPSEKLPILTFRRKFLRRMRPRTELLHLNRDFTLFVPFLIAKSGNLCYDII